MITSYSFGNMVVDGQEFKKDLIILSDGTIHHPWWRKSGHQLTLDDLGPILASLPGILVVGTGVFGLMKPDPAMLEELEGKGVTVKAMPTKKAIAEYNALAAGGEKVAACFHLTC
jgi:hypothetical protein